MKNITISIIVPIYNTEEHLLSNCLSSIVSQLDENMELILVDDGSDNIHTIRQIDKIVRDFERVQLIRTENLGVSNARNVGINAAHGIYVMFVDADDELMEGSLSEVLDYAIRGEFEIIIFGYTHIEERKPTNKYELLSKEDYLISVIRGKKGEFDKYNMNCDSPWAKIFRKDFIIENRIIFPFGMRRAQDLIFCIYSYEMAKSIAFCNDVIVYKYIINKDSVCQKISSTTAEMLPYIEEYLNTFIHTFHNDDRRFEVAKSKRILQLMGEAETLFYSSKKAFNSMFLASIEHKKLLNDQHIRQNINNLKLSDFDLKSEFTRMMQWLMYKYRLSALWLQFKRVRKI